ncbi:LptF/LptG family permease [Candidatus Pelagibacter sp. Uisw_092]|uniref:LptF/LptG family permease n=1 Tax=Candidatus Pelagibacter sp. Uisw_092 TaxID=3230979 RepID=UPI0039EC48D9
MKKLLFLHFFKDTVKFFLIICLSISLIVWIIQAVKFLDFVTEDGHSMYVYFLYTLHNFPKIIHRVLPFVFFISLFYQINNYEIRNELIIFWTIGISKFKFVKFILTLSAIFFVIQFILGGFISPWSQNKARSYIKNSNLGFFPSLIKEGKFIDTVKNLTIFIESENKPGSYNNIFIKEDYDSSFDSSKIIIAKYGLLKSIGDKKYLQLFNGKIINKSSQKINDFSFEKIDFDLMKFGSKSISHPKIQELNSSLLIKCLIYESKGIAEQLESEILMCTKKSSKFIQEEILKRFLKPIYLPLLSLIASLIIFVSKEDKKFIFYKGIFFFIGVFTIIFSEITLRYSSESLYGKFVFIAIPLIVLTTIFIYLFKKDKKIK